MLKFCMTTMLLIEMAIIIVLMRSNANFVFNYEREQKNHDTSIQMMRDSCAEKVSRMLMQKCEEEEMPAGGGMRLEFGNLPQGLENGDYTIVVENNHPESAYIIPIIELPPEWGIGDVELED